MYCTVLYLTVLYCTILYCRWGVYQHDPEEEHPRPEYLAQLERVEARTLNPVTRTLEPRPPFWGMQVLRLYCTVLYCTLPYCTMLYCTVQVPRLLLSWTILALLVILTCAAVFSVILYRSHYVIVIILHTVLLMPFI